jgi:hypothetical protein
MRTMECPCGITLTGVDDDELFRLGRAHADEHHSGDNSRPGRSMTGSAPPRAGAGHST